MKGKSKTIDPLPDSFASEEEAGEFWDSHSTMDYVEYLEPVDDVIAIEAQIYEISVKADIFQRLQQKAQGLHEPIPIVVDQILRESLAMA